MRFRDLGKMRSLTTRELFSKVPAALPDHFSSSSNIGILITGGACSPNVLTPLALAARQCDTSFCVCPAEGFDQLHARALMDVSVESVRQALQRRIGGWLQEWHRTRSKGELYLIGHSYGGQRAVIAYEICRQMEVPVAGIGLIAPAFCLKDIQFMLAHGMYSGKLRPIFDWLARDVGQIPYLLRWNGGIGDYFRDRHNGREYEDRFVLSDIGVFDLSPIYFAGQYFRTIDLAADIAPRVACPVTVFWPKKDRMVEAGGREVLDRFRDLREESVAGDHFYFIAEGGDLRYAMQIVKTVLASGKRRP